MCYMIFISRFYQQNYLIQQPTELHIKIYLIRKDLPPHAENLLKIKPQRYNYEVR